MTFFMTQCGQNQGLWRHFSDKMSLGLGGVFQLMKMVTHQRSHARLIGARSPAIKASLDVMRAGGQHASGCLAELVR